MKTPLYKLYSDKNNVYIKRDDLIPFSFGGNKYRIAKSFIDDMEAKNANHIISYGPPSSNLCRVIANMAKSKGVKCSIVSIKMENNFEYYNSRILKGLGAEQIFCTRDNVAKTIEKTLNDSRNSGFVPYYIYGDKYGNGNEKVPVSAYYDVFSEIVEQEKELGIHFDNIYLAAGTGMTYSGLLCASLDNDLSHNITALSISRCCDDGLKYIKKYVEAFRGVPVDERLINFIDKYRIQYGEYNQGILRTIKQVFGRFGVPLDPIYTGKAFWAMENELKNLKGQNVLFIHTGGTPIFFDFAKNIMEEQ